MARRRDPVAPKRQALTSPIVGSSRGAVPPLPAARFPGPHLRTRRASHPGTGLSPSRRPLARRAPMGAGFAVPAVHGVPVFTRNLLPFQPHPAGSLPPFALCPALPGSDYYEGSATPERRQLTASLPTTWRATSGASHVPRLPIDEGGAQLNPGSIAIGTPQAFPMASCSALCSEVGVARRHDLGGRALQPGPHPPGSGPVVNLRDVNAGSSRTPSRLACRTRAVWQCRPVPSLSGLLPSCLAPPRQGCPQLHQPAATGQRWSPCTSTRSNGTSWRTTGFDDFSAVAVHPLNDVLLGQRPADGHEPLFPLARGLWFVVGVQQIVPSQRAPAALRS